MSEDIDFEGVDKITFGALGPPGRRTFYLQVRQGLELVTLVVEKDHVVALGEGTEDILKSAGYPEESIEWDDDSMALEEPVEAEFRVGSMVVGYAEDRDLVLIECRAQTEASDEPGAEPQPGPVARFWITRAQLEALSAHGLAVAAQGRPLCPLCRVPMNPEGHVCYATNGHRTEA